MREFAKFVEEALVYPVAARPASARRNSSANSRASLAVWRLIHAAYRRSDHAAWASPDGSIRRLRSAPSAGARYPVRLHAFVRSNEECRQYRYHPATEEFDHLGSTVCVQDPTGENASIILISCDPTESINRYGARGLLYAITDAGYVVFNLAAMLLADGLDFQLQIPLAPGIRAASLPKCELPLAAVALPAQTLVRLEAISERPKWPRGDGVPVGAVDREIQTWRRRRELIELRRSIQAFEPAAVSCADVAAACSNAEHLFSRHFGEALPSPRIHLFGRTQEHGDAASDFLITAGIARLCLGQAVSLDAAGAIAIVFDPIACCGNSEDTLSTLVGQQLAAGIIAQAIALELLERELATTPIGAFDGIAIEQLIGPRDPDPRIALLLLFGKNTTTDSRLKVDRS